MIGGLLVGGTASAAPGGPDPLECLTSTAFLSQGSPTQLKAQSYAIGESKYNNVGPVSSYTYNAIAYNPTDNYIYANSGGNSGGNLLQIGADGEVADKGAIQAPPEIASPVTSVRAGFDDSGTYYSVLDNVTQLITVDVNADPPTASLAATISEAWSPPDITFLDGYFWGMAQKDGVNQVWRLDPGSGAVSTFPFAAVTDLGEYGAAWTFGNGNLGFSSNSTGMTFQVEVTDPGSASPTFRRVAAVPGPLTGSGNDGTACVSAPADLDIMKTGPAEVVAGEKISWSITVRNNGEGISTGFTVTDEVPANVTDVASSDPGVTVDGNEVTYNGGRLDVGDEATFTVTGTAPDSTDTCFENTASVLGNEEDPSGDNDSDTSRTCTYPTEEAPTPTPVHTEHPVTG